MCMYILDRCVLCGEGGAPCPGLADLVRSAPKRACLQLDALVFTLSKELGKEEWLL